MSDHEYATNELASPHVMENVTTKDVNVLLMVLHVLPTVILQILHVPIK